MRPARRVLLASSGAGYDLGLDQTAPAGTSGPASAANVVVLTHGSFSELESLRFRTMSS